jgi:putative MATE family efflux protein
MQQKDFTKGSILKALIQLSIPLILTNILQTAYNLTDTFWVGRLGSSAVAAVSLSFPIIFIMISLGMGMAIAGSILVAQQKGAKNHKLINHIASQTMVAVFIFSLILAAIGYVLSPLLIKIMKVEPTVFQEAVKYLKVSFLGMPFMFVFMVFQSMMRSIGEVKLPFYIVFSTVLLNLVLDPLFIFGWRGMVPAFGVAGAAYASIGTQLLAAIIGLYILIKGNKGIKIDFRNYIPDNKLLKKMIKMGIPVSIEQVSRSLGIFAMIMLVTAFGTLALASYGIGSRILSFIIIPAFGLGMATSTLVGQNIGAGKPDRVKQTIKLSLNIAFGVMSFFGLVFFVFAADIARFFIPKDPATIKESAVFIKHIAVSFGFMGILIVLVGAFRGAGKTKISMLLTLFSVWILRFPLAFFLSKYTSMGLRGIWVSYPLTNIITALIGLLILFKYHWLTQTQKV